MKEKPDMGRWFRVEEVTLGSVRHHVAKLIPCITLGDDAFSHGHRDITTIGLLCDIEEEFTHREKTTPWTRGRQAKLSIAQRDDCEGTLQYSTQSKRLRQLQG